MKYLIVVFLCASMLMTGCSKSSDSAATNAPSAGSVAGTENTASETGAPPESSAPTASESAAPIPSSSAESAPSESAAPTASSSAASSPSASAAPTVSPTASPSAAATASPSVAPTAAAKASNGQAFSVKDLHLIVKGKQVSLAQDASEILKLVGKNYTQTDSVSCAYQGMDRMFEYDGLTICTIPIGGKDITDEVLISGQNYSTTRGIKINSTVEEVKKAYGEGYTDDGNTITYWAGAKNGLKTPRLYFQYENNKVNLISIFGAKSAG